MKFKVGSAREWFLAYRTWPRPPEPRTPQIYGKHTCGCESCDPELAVASQRLGVGHFSVNLGDARLRARFGDSDLDMCIELLCGPAGWALCISTPSHLCDTCQKSYCKYRIFSDEFSVTEGSAS